MLPPYQTFDPAKTHCPSCNATLSELVDACPFCGFNAHLCVKRYPFSPPPLSRFVDPGGQLQKRDRRQLAKSIGQFEKRFPQITISVAYMALPENVEGREFGYWFLNRAEVADETERRRRLHHILFIVDRTSSTVSITVGYGLDCFLDDQFLYFSLENTATEFQSGGFVAGICAWLKHTGKQLIKVHREAWFARDRWRRHMDRSGGLAPVPAPAPNQVVSQGYHEVAEAAPIPKQGAARIPVPDRELP